ncbi:MAG: cytochrome c [Sulfurovum sp.]|nr:MAG: cytochrome c [Sulfurovum sp.]
MKKIAIAMLFAGSTLVMAADGAALFAKCAGCHGQNGEKSALGKSAIIKGLDAATVEKDIQGYKAGTLNKHGMGALMKGQVASLSDEDIKALAQYISSLK